MTHEADSELLDEALLRRAFKQRRVEPRAFREAVERKIAEREKQRAADDQRIHSAIAASPLLRRAAGILPPGLLPDTAIAAGVGASAKWAVWKSLVAVIAFPATVLAMLVATFVVGVRSVGALQGGGGGELRDGTRAALARAEMARWWRKQSVGVCLIWGLAFYLLMSGRAFELVMGILVASMVLLVLLLRELSRVQLASRAQVGQLCGRMLVSICLYVGIGAQNAVWEPLGSYGVLWILAGLLVFSVACSALGTRVEAHALTSNRWRRWTPLYGALAVSVLLVIGTDVRGVAPRDLAQYAAQLAASNDSRPDLPQLASVVDCLKRNGYGAPDLSAARTAFAARLANDELDAGDLDAATRLGWIGRTEWEALKPRWIDLQVQNWLDGTGSGHPFKHMNYALRGLVLLGNLAPADRERAVERVLAEWPTGTESFDLSAMRDVCDSLDIMGRLDALESKRAEVLRTLESCWVKSARRRAHEGGFSDYPKRFPLSQAEPTYAAVELMIRFGVPAEIDLKSVRKYLLTATEHGLIGHRFRDYDLPAAMALLDLEKHLPVPELSVADVAPGLSILIGSALLVVFCLYATLRAPRVAIASGSP
jgi:hypothetical protein